MHMLYLKIQTYVEINQMAGKGPEDILSSAEQIARQKTIEAMEMRVDFLDFVKQIINDKAQLDDAVAFRYTIDIKESSQALVDYYKMMDKMTRAGETKMPDRRITNELQGLVLDTLTLSYRESLILSSVIYDATERIRKKYLTPNPDVACRLSF